MGCARSNILRPTGFLDIKTNKNGGEGSAGRISRRLLMQTEMGGPGGRGAGGPGGVFRLTAKELGTFSSISCGLQKSSQIT